MENYFEYPTLYKRTNSDNIMSWTIIVSNDSYYTSYGVVDGVKIKTKATVCKGKNIGKSNETSPFEQALKEAKSIWNKKIKSENYCENYELVKNSKINLVYNPPMLALKYNKSYNKDMKYVQPKLDGIRCNIHFDGNNTKAISRKNHPFNYIPHIIDSLDDICRKYPSIHFDGELYNHDMHDDFEGLVSLIRKEKEPSDEEKQMIVNCIQYYVYDIWDDNNPNMLFSERNKIINDILKNVPYIVIVPTFEVHSHADIDNRLNIFLSDGYEGCIIRTDKPYEHKRSKQLLKYKLFSDAEFKILDICEGSGNLSHVAGFCIIQLPEDRGTCKCNIKGNVQWKYELLHNKEKYIGKLGTVTYFEETNDGKLRFPYLKTIRDYE